MLFNQTCKSCKSSHSALIIYCTYYDMHYWRIIMLSNNQKHQRSELQMRQLYSKRFQLIRNFTVQNHHLHCCIIRKTRLTHLTFVYLLSIETETLWLLNQYYCISKRNSRIKTIATLHVITTIIIINLCYCQTYLIGFAKLFNN